MSIDNINNFVKESSIHIANINRALKNTKSDVMADFIQVKTMISSFPLIRSLTS